MGAEGVLGCRLLSGMDPQLGDWCWGQAVVGAGSWAVAATGYTQLFINTVESTCGIFAALQYARQTTCRVA